MFRIRPIYDEFLPVNRTAIDQALPGNTSS